MLKTFARLAGIVSTATIASAGAAMAAQPAPWEITLQPAATNIMSEINWFANYTMAFMVPIVMLVMGLLGYAIFRFRKSANPNPSRTSHNTTIEIIWTVGPVFILLLLAVPSFQLLSAQYTPPSEPEITIKATGYQWYWGYEYQGEEEGEEVSFDSYMLREDERADAGKEDKDAYPRLLAVDNEIVVPVDTTVRLLVTAGDVLHSWTIPAFGVKMDAVPGRLNETWFHAEREGIFYGQCSELCGKDHAFMPIAVRVVSRDQYDGWVTTARADVSEANKSLMAALEAGRTLAAAE